MVKTKAQALRSVRAFLKETAKSYNITQAILFGSYAHGKPRRDSDIDVAVVSPDFKGRPEMKLLQALARIAMRVDTALEVVAFSPDELMSPDPRSFSYQVATTGIKIPFS